MSVENSGRSVIFVTGNDVAFGDSVAAAEKWQNDGYDVTMLASIWRDPFFPFARSAEGVITFVEEAIMQKLASGQEVLAVGTSNEGLAVLSAAANLLGEKTSLEEEKLLIGEKLKIATIGTDFVGEDLDERNEAAARLRDKFKNGIGIPKKVTPETVFHYVNGHEKHPLNQILNPNASIFFYEGPELPVRINSGGTKFQTPVEVMLVWGRGTIQRALYPEGNQ